MSQEEETPTQPLNIKAIVLSLLMQKPFFGFIVSKMDIIEDKHSYIGAMPTAATDGKNIFYNKKFIDSLSQKERIFLFAHEIMHCVLDTMGRKGSKDHQYWNMATDYVINGVLVEEKVGEMPKMGLYDHKYQGWTAEAVYEDLLKNNKGKKETLDVHLELSDLESDGEEGDGQDGPEMEGKVGGKGKKPSKKEMAEISKNFKKLIIEAYQRSKMGGHDIGGVERLISDLINPRINWKQLLQTNLQSIFKTDMTWNRPNRRNPMGNVILPSMTFQDTVDICVSIDTSGSICEAQLIEFLSEISGILKFYSSFKLKIWCFDTAVHNMQEYDQHSINELKEYRPGGGGGTDIGCNFAFMEAEDIKPKQFICMTDGYNCSDSWGPVDFCPTTWLIHSNPNPQVPWGRWALFEELIS